MPKRREGTRFASGQPVHSPVESIPGATVRPDLPDADAGQPSAAPSPRSSPMRAGCLLISACWALIGAPLSPQ
ncbi:MAG: hypothetical protein QOG14_3327 [Mycobacterium sp.]|jgi:hypothetical protein|nr:hypothetical protein [Mycobacterium sp.]